MSILIYTKDHCPYCTKAKMLLDSLGANYEEVDLSQNPEKMDELRQKAPHARTVPQIFIHGEPIGGCDDLHALHQKGQLLPKIKASNA